MNKTGIKDKRIVNVLFRAVKKCRLVVNETEGASVIRRDAVRGDAKAVFFGGVARVVVPSVERKLLVERLHVVVSIGFGQYAGSRNAEKAGIALDECGVWDAAVGFEAVSVDDDVLRTRLQSVECAVHCKD